MEDVVLNRIKKELNWRERIILRMFKKTFIKVYNIGRVNLINYFLE